MLILIWKCAYGFQPRNPFSRTVAQAQKVWTDSNLYESLNSATRLASDNSQHVCHLDIWRRERFRLYDFSHVILACDMWFLLRNKSHIAERGLASERKT